MNTITSISTDHGEIILQPRSHFQCLAKTIKGLRCTMPIVSGKKFCHRHRNLDFIDDETLICVKCKSEYALEEQQSCEICINPERVQCFAKTIRGQRCQHNARPHLNFCKRHKKLTYKNADSLICVNCNKENIVDSDYLCLCISREHLPLCIACSQYGKRCEMRVHNDNSHFCTRHQNLEGNYVDENMMICVGCFQRYRQEDDYEKCANCRMNDRRETYERAQLQDRVIRRCRDSTMRTCRVQLNNNSCTVCEIDNANGKVLFLIDTKNEEKLERDYFLTLGIEHNGRSLQRNQIQQNFILQTKRYIARNINIYANGKSVVLLHNLIMNFPLFGGKGQTTTVDHINRNGRDNREENLRVISQSLQNLNQMQKAKVQKPEYNFNANFMPKNIHFKGGRENATFEFHLKIDGKTYRCSKTLANEVPMHMKLLFLIEILKQIHYILPEYVRFLPEHFTDEIEMERIFNAFIMASIFSDEVKQTNLSNNYQFVFATAKESLQIQREENKFYVLIPTKTEKETLKIWIEQEQAAIDVILENFRRIRDA